jgi:hypothetical protein
MRSAAAASSQTHRQQWFKFFAPASQTGPCRESGKKGKTGETGEKFDLFRGRMPEMGSNNGILIGLAGLEDLTRFPYRAALYSRVHGPYYFRR